MPRQKTDKSLPPRVYANGASYYYIAPTKPKQTWIKLCKIADGTAALYRAYATLVAKIEAEEAQATAPKDMMPAVIAAWLEHKKSAKSWAPKQALEMESKAAVLSNKLAEFRACEVKPAHVVQVLDAWIDKPRTHNVYRNIMHQVFDWALLRGLCDGANPVDPTKGRSTPGRRRIVQDDEVAALQAKLAANRVALSGANSALAEAIELCRLTGQRIGDVLAMTWDQVTPEGLVLAQKKTDAKLLIRLTPALSSAPAACEARSGRTGHLLKTREGKPYTYFGIRSAWVRACKSLGIEDLNIHDLRGLAGAKVRQNMGLDAAQALLGHSSQRTTEHYTDGKFSVVVTPPE